MQTSTRDLDLEFEGYLSFLEQQDLEDQEDESYYQYGSWLMPLEQLDQQLQLNQAQEDARDGQTASFKQPTTQTEPQLNRQAPNNDPSTDTTVRQSPAQQKLSQVDGGDRKAGSTARQLSAQQHPQLDRAQWSQLTQRNAGNPQTATRSQSQVQQASLSPDRRSGNNARGTRTTGGQLAAQHQKQLGRGALSYTRSIGATSGQSLVQKQSKFEKQGSSSDNPIVITHEQPSAPQQQLLDRGATNNVHLPRATPQPPAQPDRTERRDASDNQNADTPNGPTPTPQHQQGQLKRKQPDSEQPHHHQRRVRQRIPGPMAPPPRPKMNVDDFPEVPRIEKIQRHLRVTYNGMEVAETSDGFWVLQQYRPPEYYLPKSSLKIPLTPTGYNPPCRFKGPRTHYSVKGPDGRLLANRVWSYEQPKPGYEAIRGYVSFYARPWQSFVDGERVVPYRTDFQGGWVTAEIVGVVSEFTPRF
ncbi:NTP-transf-9 domain-containing protein [Fusarium falciforme]|uniref:NTP-transf-9 domain-containing protein n=1 Tax=Fusarium falciforme TaxID=195108 RepID=UPI0023016166|nr:NTP-transf-9 domain-containing protein [Fusarium falciforme]WAO87147.1 NTP-transf-9 domain-containing protein [Fusarium falciforme]